MPGSRKWPATQWRRLLELILPALDDLPEEITWAVGGGTALALKLNHRISYDIDVFFEDARALRLLSPQRNEKVRQIAGSWQEPGTYIKLEREEGEIDLIVAANRTERPTWRYRFEDRFLRFETPAEVLAKKLYYRGSRFLPRDVFDVLALIEADPRAVRLAVAAAPEGARRAADRIRRIATRLGATLGEEVNPTQGGAHLLQIDPLAAAEHIEALLPDGAARP